MRLAVDADADCIHAQMTPAGATIATDAAGDMAFGRNAIANLKAL